MELEERAAEAQAILNNPAFKAAMECIHSRSLNILIAADVGSLTASSAHATLKALRDVEAQLADFSTELALRRKFPKGYKNG